MKYILLLPIFALFMACAESESPYLQTPPEKVQSVILEASEAKVLPNPKVNFVFVMDNSGSMQKHQDLVLANIGKTVDLLLDNPRLESKMAVLTVYDRIEHTHACATKGNVRKKNPWGELVPLKYPDGTLVDTDVRFVTRDTPNAKEILKATAAVGVQCGPEAEESFSPVLKLVENTLATNVGFYDPDAYLVILFVTDADDVTPGLSANQFYEALLQAKGGNREKILIAAALPNMDGSCPVDNVGRQFSDLLYLSNGLRFDLCSKEFGKQFAEFASLIENKIATQTYTFPFIPDDTLSVTYGAKNSSEQERKIIPRSKDGKDGGYTYIPGTKTILIPANIKVKKVDNGGIFLKARPVSKEAIQDGRAKQQGI